MPAATGPFTYSRKANVMLKSLSTSLHPPRPARPRAWGCGPCLAGGRPSWLSSSCCRCCLHRGRPSGDASTSAAAPPGPSSVTCSSESSTSPLACSPWPGRYPPPWFLCCSSPVGPLSPALSRSSLPSTATKRRNPRHVHPRRSFVHGLGVVLCARPGMGAISLALLFGFFNLVAGSGMLVRGAEVRRTHSRLHTLVQPKDTKVAA